MFLWSLCGLELFWRGGGGAFRVGDSDIDGNMDMGSELVDGGNGARRLEPELSLLGETLELFFLFIAKLFLRDVIPRCSSHFSFLIFRK